MKFVGNCFQTELLSRLSHKVCRLLPAAVPLRKFTIIYYYQIISGMADQLKFIGKAAENIIALLHQKLFMATAVGNCAGKVAFPGHLYLKKKSLDTIRTSGS